MHGLAFDQYTSDAGENVGTGIRDPLKNLVYRVHPLPESMVDHVYDFGALPPETEEIYIRAMLKRQLGIYLHEQKHAAADDEKKGAGHTPDGGVGADASAVPPADGKDGNDRLDKYRAMMRKTMASGGTFRIGQKVKAKYRNKKGNFYYGRISALNADGTYAVRFDDGDTDNKVRIRRAEKPARCPEMTTPDASDRAMLLCLS
eukprot:jgi/Bigna1/142948/aug1.74_g17656